MGVASDFVDGFVEPLDEFVTDSVTNLAAAVEAPLLIAATLYIVITGIFTMLGYVRSPLSDFVINVLKIAILVALTTNVENYNFYVKDFFFTALPDGISSVIGQVPGSTTSAADVSSGAAFDRMIDRIIAMSTMVSEQGGPLNLYPIFVATFFVIIAVVVALVILAVVLYAKVGLALLLILGPVFIALVLFKSTQGFFSAWIGALANFVILQVLLLALVTLLLSLIDSYLTTAFAGSAVDIIAATLRVEALFALALYITFTLPQIAASMSGGGVALGTGLLNGAANLIARGAGAPPVRGAPSASRNTITRQDR